MFGGLLGERSISRLLTPAQHPLSGILLALHEKQAAFIIREHGAHPAPSVTSELRRVGRVETGIVFEQSVEVKDTTGRLLWLRRVELQLDEPTEDGETVIRLLTDVPAERLEAQDVARLYRRRWTVEGMFQRLESALKSEVRTLGHPRAALLAFDVAVVAYNVLATLHAAVESAHPQAKAEGIEVSAYFVASEVKTTYGGMMIAVPAEVWATFDEQTPTQLTRTLLSMAANVEPKKLRKHPRGPKKKVRRGYVSGRVARRHVSTARVLASERVD